MTGRCGRCGDTILVDGRRRVNAHDRTESTIGGWEGRLCSSCWGKLMDFLNGAPLARGRKGGIST